MLHAKLWSILQKTTSLIPSSSVRYTLFKSSIQLLGFIIPQDLLNIARTTLSSKIVTLEKDHFANMVVDAVLRLKGSTNLDSIHIIKKLGGSLRDSYLDEGFILEKRIGVGCPKRVENAKILLANTAMDTDKIKIFGARVKVNISSSFSMHIFFNFVMKENI